MEVLIYIMLISGIAIMVTNILRYTSFLRSMRDVLSSGRGQIRFWKYLAHALLIFFLCGYIFVTLKFEPNILIGGLLFGGSVFVAIILTLMSKLMLHTKERSIDIAEVLIGVIDARDPNLNGHSRHVQQLTMLLYEYLPSQKRSSSIPSALNMQHLCMM